MILPYPRARVVKISKSAPRTGYGKILQAQLHKHFYAVKCAGRWVDGKVHCTNTS